jgi:hypothetical protein
MKNRDIEQYNLSEENKAELRHLRNLRRNLRRLRKKLHECGQGVGKERSIRGRIAEVTKKHGLRKYRTLCNLHRNLKKLHNNLRRRGLSIKDGAQIRARIKEIVGRKIGERICELQLNGQVTRES